MLRSMVGQSAEKLEQRLMFRARARVRARGVRALLKLFSLYRGPAGVGFFF